MGRREQIIQVGAKIQSLRSELARLEYELDLLLEADDGPVSPRQVHDPAVVAAHEAEASAAQRIVGLLDEFSDREFGVLEIARLLQLENVQSARSALARLARAGKISKSATRGRYRSASHLRIAEEVDYAEDDEDELGKLEGASHEGLNGAPYAPEDVADE
ncbi:hypothetical protein WMF39_15250 [Sorangium sp. So ce1504]|uniref:hypothetical protein n=1 Tax=Sorangium sp. So ce1504 TaxID=3133337 RepID=UPI003F61CF41